VFNVHEKIKGEQSQKKMFRREKQEIENQKNVILVVQ
jgi:hypothetical protein